MCFRVPCAEEQAAQRMWVYGNSLPLQSSVTPINAVFVCRDLCCLGVPVLQDAANTRQQRHASQRLLDVRVQHSGLHHTYCGVQVSALAFRRLSCQLSFAVVSWVDGSQPAYDAYD
jgi:hypothetical protein